MKKWKVHLSTAFPIYLPTKRRPLARAVGASSHGCRDTQHTCRMCKGAHPPLFICTIPALDGCKPHCTGPQNGTGRDEREGQLLRPTAVYRHCILQIYIYTHTRRFPAQHCVRPLGRALNGLMELRKSSERTSAREQENSAQRT